MATVTALAPIIAQRRKENEIKRLRAILEMIEAKQSPYLNYAHYHGYAAHIDYLASLAEHALHGTPVRILPEPTWENDDDTIPDDFSFEDQFDA